jgi:CarboxypepD_reg-like domain
MMHKALFIVSCFILLASKSIAQSFSIKGKITDATTGKAVAGASVFLSNTSYGNISSNTGAFEINNIRQGKYDLIVSFIGYETYNTTIQIPAPAGPLTIQIKQKSKELTEVVVRNYVKDGWQQWGSFFLESFIGTSALANQCILKNKETLKFSFSKKENLLIVDAIEPLIIENKALGYNIQYQLENFTYSFDEKLLFYAGYPLFTEMEAVKSKQRKWEDARADVYEVSLMRFMRSLYRNKLTEDGYQLLVLKRIPNLERQRWFAKQKRYYDTVQRQKTTINYESTLPKDSLAYFNKVITQKDPIETILPNMLTGSDIAYGADSITAALDFANHLIIRFPKRTIPQEYANSIRQGSVKQPVSSIIFLPNNTPVYVTSGGYYYNAEDLIMEGFWGWWEKISSLLPYDYMPLQK